MSGVAPDAMTFDLRRSWFINGDLPLGLSVSLLAESRPPAWPDGFEMRLTVSHPLAPGPAALTVTSAEDDSQHVAVELANTDQPGSLTAAITPIRPASHSEADASILIGPEDVMPFGGAKPGVAALFEIRPLPFSPCDEGSSGAWLRPLTSNQQPPSLLALDGWLPASMLDEVRNQMYTAVNRPLPRRFVRTAEVCVRQVPWPGNGDWIHIRSWVTHRDERHVFERGEITDRHGQNMMQFRIERECVQTNPTVATVADD
ncbi:MAG: hotdog fold domain-containing protein [Actinomycetota bacterium]